MTNNLGREFSQEYILLKIVKTNNFTFANLLHYFLNLKSSL